MTSKTQPLIFKTDQFKEINSIGVGHIMQSDKALREPPMNRF